MPFVERDFKDYPIHRSFIGHSLGGLFATYLFLYNDSLFQDLYALSPSLWIDDYHLLQYESQRGSQFEEFQKNYWVSCGSAEKLNRIVGGVKRFSDSLERRNYPTVRHRATIYKGKTHNSSVGPALEDIFTSFTDGGDVFH